MADEPTPAAAEAAEETTRPVPYARFQEVNEQTRTLKQQLAEANARLREREEAEMSAVERERTQRERLEAQLQELTSQNTRLTRGQMLVEAARSAGFADPTDAAALIDPTSVETEAQARRAVKELADRKPHLVEAAAPAPEIGQVLRNGEPVDAHGATVEQLRAQARKQLNDDLRQAAGVTPQ